jgi:protein phosphatase
MYEVRFLTRDRSPLEIVKRIHINADTSRIQACGVSDVGNVRTNNEDAIYIDKDGRLLLLADGMGGHERGEEASAAAIEIIKNHFNPDKIRSELEDTTDGIVPVEIGCFQSIAFAAVERTNSELFTRNKRDRLRRYMGTTIVGVVLVEGSYVLWFHVGDSRIYRFRDSSLKLLTEDHSAYAEWVHNGRPGSEPSKSIITRAIGPRAAVLPTINWDKWVEGDTYILCSDGLTDMIDDDKIEGILKSESDIVKIADALADAAIAAGGKDNTSVVVCKLQ